MRRFLLAGAAALALTGCTAFEDEPATMPGNALYRVAERLAASGDAPTAAALYRSAIAMGNTAPDVRRGYGNALLALGQPQDAIEQFEAALAQAKDGRIYNSLGVAYDMMGDHARAQERFREGLALAPDNNGLIHNYGLSLAASAEAEKKAAQPIAEAAPEQPAAFAPTTAALQPMPVEELKPIVRPSAVPTVIPTMKSKPVAMRDARPEQAAAPVVPPAAKPVAMRDSMPEPVSPQVAPPTAEPAAMRDAAPEPVSPQATQEPTPALEPVALLTPEISPVPFTRINEIVPLRNPETATSMRGGSFRMRLAGYGSRERAVEFRREIERQAPELRESVRVVEERPSLALGARPRFTLISAPLPSRDAAEAACETLAERGLACLAEPAASPLTLRL